MAEASVIIIGEEYCREEERELTVRKTSLFYPGDGYAAYDHVTGELVFRVDSYGRGTSVSDHLVLMDPTGVPILTVRRKRPSLHHRWEGFLGEREEGQKPLFSVKRSSIFGKDRSIDIELHKTDNNSSSNNTGNRQYRIEGCFAQRTCKVLMTRCSDFEDEQEEMVAEIKRKVDAFSHVVLAKDVFCLCIKPGFDAAFAMGLVLVLDQISGDEDDNDDHSIFRAVKAYRVAPTNDDDDTSIMVE